ncbi:hypothetical protein HanIR_Chr06g0284671 [Helianthus annuus]|nr:hypothetical protein HanIR_Chr06g0284671 [Helianthus annuus]
MGYRCNPQKENLIKWESFFFFFKDDVNILLCLRIILYLYTKLFYITSVLYQNCYVNINSILYQHINGIILII